MSATQEQSIALRSLWHQFASGMGNGHVWWSLGWYEFGYLQGLGWHLREHNLHIHSDFCMKWEQRLVDLEGGEH